MNGKLQLIWHDALYLLSCALVKQAVALLAEVTHMDLMLSKMAENPLIHETLVVQWATTSVKRQNNRILNHEGRTNRVLISLEVTFLAGDVQRRIMRL